MVEPTISKQDYNMARPVKINTFDEFLHVNQGVWVHKHLICDISAKMQELATNYEQRMHEFMSHSGSGITAKDKPSMRLLSNNQRGLQLWTGFLYGQPIWSYSGQINLNEDFEALSDVHIFARSWGHHDAQNASIDAIRDIVHSHSGSLVDPFTTVFANFGIFHAPVRVLIDHVAYGKHVTDARKWVHDYLDGEIDVDSREPLGDELCKILLAKTEDESNDKAPPDLMERCRYHCHQISGQPCYLDK